MDFLQELENRISDNITCIIDVGEEVKRVGDSVVGDDCQLDMKTAMLDCILLQKKISNFKKAVEHVQSKIKANETENNAENPEVQLMEHFEALNGNIEDNLTRNHDYKTLTDQLESSSLEFEAVASTGNIVEDAENSMVMTQEVNIPLDPITKMGLVDPVFNKICKHYYERDVIMQHIAKRKKFARCPVSGCGNNALLRPNILEDDADMKRLIARSKRGDESVFS